MSQLKSRPFALFSCLFFLCLDASAQIPNISSFSPGGGAVGSAVIISGSNFSTVAQDNIVYFGDVKAVVSHATATNLTVLVPAGATYKPISVTVNGLTAYSLFPFTVTFASDGSAYSSNSFSAKADSSWGFGVTCIGATDLNGDGHVDPVLVCTSSNYISILKNNSSIGSISLSYSPSSKYTTGTSPVNVSFGDFDGDGKQDIAVVNTKDSSISVFKNNSSLDTIHLLPKIDLATGSSPSIAVVSDVDKDGKPDIICTNSGSNTISVFRNTTNGSILSFAAKIDYATGKAPYGLLVFDIDGNGTKEVIVANETDLTLSVFTNTSTPGSINLGTRTDLASGYVSLLTAADFDGDGKIDIASTAKQASFFAVLRNTSSPGIYSFAPGQQFTTGFGSPTTLATADIDGDGKPDAAVNHSYYSTVSVVKNLSQPGIISFSSNTDFYVSQMPPSILLTDLDNDARPDIVSAGSGLSALSILRNLVPKPYISSVTPVTAGNGGSVTISGHNFLTTSQVSFGGTPASSFMVQSPSIISAVADTGSTGEVSVTTAYGVARYAGFNFSKVPTITSFTPAKGGSGTVVNIQGTNFSNTTSVNFNNVPASSFAVVSPTSITATVGSLSDGNYDLSVTNSSGTATLGSFYTGVTISSYYPTSGPVGTTVTINGAHFSSNPSNDIVYFGSVSALVLSAAPASLTVSVPPGATFEPISVTVNNLTAYSSQPFVVTFNGTGNEFTASSFGDRVDSSAGNFPYYVSIADLDHDGRSDIVTSNADGTISVSKNTSTNGLTSFQYKKDYTTAKTGVWSTSAGDLDGDGKIEFIAVTSDNTVNLERSFSVFKNVSTGDSITLTRTDYPIGVMNSNPRYSAIADFDEDGKPDVTFLSFSGLAILRNTSTSGALAFAPKIDLFINIFSESQIAIGDVDGDGKPDIVIVGYSDNVLVFRNTSNPGHISFAQPVSITTGSVPRSVALGDFDNDGKPDMAVLNGGNNSISIFENRSVTGVIAFNTRNTYPLNVIPDNLALGDLDGDGRLDIAFVTTRDKFVYVLKNTNSLAAFSFADKVAYDAPYTPGHVSIGDINNDGKADIVVSNASNGNNFSVLVNKCQKDSQAAPIIMVSGPTEFCEGGNVVLKTASVSGGSYQWYKDGFAIAAATDSAYTATVAGIYLVKIFASGVSAGSAPVIVSVKSNPTAPVLTSGTGNLCRGTATLLHSSTQVGIQWYKDNVRINGISDSIYKVDSAGKYQVGTMSNGCLSPLSNEVTITTFPVPDPVISTSATSFCSGDSTTLTANPVTGYSYQWNVDEEQIQGATARVFTSPIGGNFTVSETDSNGCRARSKIITLTRYPSPLKPGITLFGSDLKSSAQNGNQWYKDGAVLTGATSQIFTPTSAGNYTVQVSQNGCKSPMSDAYSFIVTGVVSIDNSHFIKLSPNPVYGEMTLEFSLSGIYQLNIDLLDLNGRIVRRWKDQKAGSVIYLSDCSKSMYLARIYSANGKINASLKLMKQ